MPEIRDRLGLEEPARPGIPNEASPELATEAMDRLDRLLSGEAQGDTLFLTGAHVSSLLEHAVSELVPPGVSVPRVAIADGDISVQGQVARRVFPELADLEPWFPVLPDTVPVSLRGAVLPFGVGEAVLVVRRVEVSGVPLPRRFHQRVLDAIGRVDRPGLPPEGITVPIPAGLVAVFAQGEHLVLVAGS